MPKCSITQSGNSYALHAPYKAGFVSQIKALPYESRAWDGNAKAWIISQDQIETAIQLIEDYYGEKVLAPELEPMNEKQKYGFRLDYVGIPKERQGQAGKTALGLSNGQWRVVFSEEVLKGWFEKQQPDASEKVFSVLCISETANDQEIKSAYRRESRTWHPDFNRGSEPGDEYFAERFRKINEAYLILSDPLKRKKYQAGLYLERSQNNQSDYRRDYYRDTFIPPLRCGNLTVTGSVTVGRLRVTEILSWNDVINEQGQTMVSSWSREREAVVIEWV
jgi:DnaJ-like protein